MNSTTKNKLFHPHLLVALEHTDLAIEITDLDGVTQYVTSPFEKITGYTCKKAIGNLPRFLKRENNGYREYTEMWKALLAGKVYKTIFRNRNKSGVEYYEDQTVAPIKDAKGKVTHLACIRQDITKTVFLQQKLLKRTQELETFLYRASHDLKSPASTIKGLINLMKDNCNPDDTPKYCEIIEKAIANMDNVLSELTAASCIYNRETNVSPIQFDKMIATALNKVKDNRRTNDINFTIDVSNTRSFHSDSFLLSAIFYHLFDNTVVFARNTHPGVLQRQRRNNQVSVRVRDFEKGVDIQISDSGGGIQSRIIEKIFGMFYKGNLKSKGAGLGLYIVKEAVEHLNGTIRVESSKGVGTKVLLYLPDLNHKQKKEGRPSPVSRKQNVA